MARRFGALVFLATLAAVFALPVRAFAAILPACEVEAQATFLPPPPEPSCEVISAVDDETGETSSAPICDPRGASAIAPPRIHPVSDASIEAVPACGDDAMAVGVVPGRKNGPSAAVDGIPLPPAILVTLVSVAPPLSSEVTWTHAALGGPLAGHHRAIERPPR